MRLINEDDVLRIVERVTNEAVEKKQPKYLIQPRIIAEIAGLPTIEAEPEKHGQWLDNGIVYTCSECNCSVPKNIFVTGCDFEGCPYCFARMDGDCK